MKKRNSNLELLRIISMFLIVMHHYSLHGLGGGLTYSLNRYLASLSILGGKLGVIIFVLISGYYMCQSEFNGRKLAKLWGQVFFYTLSIFVIFIFMEKVGAIDNFYNPTGLRDFLPILMPIGHQVYWFVTCFVILMVVSPLLNLILRTLSKKRLLICLSIATLFWSIIPVFSALFTSNTYAFNNVGWFLILYLFAGYIRFHVQANSNWKFNLKLALLSGSVVAAFAVIMVFIGHKISNPALDQFSALLAEINSPFTLILGIELFLTFLKMEPFSSRFINIIASTTFGVYLIHDHPLVREFLWKKLLKLPESIYYSKWLWIHMIVTVLMVFIFSSGIDFLRQATFEKMYMKAVDKVENAVQLLSKKLLDFSYCFWEKILS